MATTIQNLPQTFKFKMSPIVTRAIEGGYKSTKFIADVFHAYYKRQFAWDPITKIMYYRGGQK